jgi:hypothetical protein
MINPPSPPDSPTATSPSVRADLAVHLSGWHVAETVEMARSVLLVFPSARLSMTHPQPVRAALTAWCDAERLAADVLPQTISRPSPPQATVSARVSFDGPVSGIQIDALPVRASPSGFAQVRVRLGALLIIAADRDAVACQRRLWQAACHHADRLWPAPPGSATPADTALTAPLAAAAALERISA